MIAPDDNNNQRDSDSEEMISSRNESTSCEQNNVENITDGINSVAILDTSVCANCGKEGNGSDMNTCNKCKMVKYCNAACKKKHRKKHKKACEKRVAELFDEQLFKEVDEPAECQICFLPLPCDENEYAIFQSCCGKIVCHGCIYAMEVSEETKDLCPFCRKPPPTSEIEVVKRIEKLMESGHAKGTYLAACGYAAGTYGTAQDWNKANELYLKAGELGCADGYHSLAYSYNNNDRGVVKDQKKFEHYIGLAAIKGHTISRVLLASLEQLDGNEERAYKHWIIAAKAGRKRSLDMVQEGFIKGVVTKDEYADTLRAYQKRQNEIKSDDRDKAAASDRFSQLSHNLH